MIGKRTLTKQQRIVRSYWPYVLGLCEELLLDLGNLGGKRESSARPIAPWLSPSDPGVADHPDPVECQRFRGKWSGVFHEWLEADDEALIGLRNYVRNALIHGDPKDLRALT